MQGSRDTSVGEIQTVLGPVSAADLGVTYSHEHLVMRGGLGLAKEPGYVLPSADKMVEELASVRAAGGRTVVDMMPIDCGRLPEELVDISQRSGMHVIAATGFHSGFYYDSEHWVHKYSSEQIVDLVVRELTEGMDRHSYGGPIVERIPARAGVVKLATEYHYATKTQLKLIESYGEVYRQTGFPFSTHTETGTFGLEQVELMGKAGVPANALVIGHLDRLPDPGYHREVLGTGAFVMYDSASRAKYGPDSNLIDILRAMIDGGFGRQILLGTDMARASYLRAYGGGPGMDYLLVRLLPRLRREGFPDAVLDDIMICNPAEAFARRHPGSSA